MPVSKTRKTALAATAALLIAGGMAAAVHAQQPRYSKT